jgi:hypothetical protein
MNSQMKYWGTHRANSSSVRTALPPVYEPQINADRAALTGILYGLRSGIALEPCRRKNCVPTYAQPAGGKEAARPPGPAPRRRRPARHPALSDLDRCKTPQHSPARCTGRGSSPHTGQTGMPPCTSRKSPCETAAAVPVSPVAYDRKTAGAETHRHCLYITLSSAPRRGRYLGG